MTGVERLSVFRGYGDISRHWVSVYEIKAGFVSAMNAAILATLWAGSGFNSCSAALFLAILATVISCVSQIMALHVVLPKTTIPQVFGKGTAYTPHHKPLSFFSFVANEYPYDSWSKFVKDANSMSNADLENEVIEQHFTMCHILQAKSNDLVLSGRLLLLAIIMASLGLIVRGIH